MLTSRRRPGTMSKAAQQTQRGHVFPLLDICDLKELQHFLSCPNRQNQVVMPITKYQSSSLPAHRSECLPSELTLFISLLTPPSREDRWTYPVPELSQSTQPRAHSFFLDCYPKHPPKAQILYVLTPSFLLISPTIPMMWVLPHDE